jgi:peptidoglycan/LPS O-acetylase OafA/YrhL
VKVASAEAASSADRIDVIDGLRGVAILMVMFRHAFFDSLASPGFGMAWFGGIPVFPFTLLSNTWMGVNLFFVDSGFVLYLPFAIGKRRIEGRADVVELYLRRAWRLFPLYYLMLAACLLLDATTLHLIRAPWFEIPAYATFTFPFFAETWQPRPNGTLWSIGTEVWFSLAFPFLVLLARRIGMARFVVLAVAIALATRYLAYVHHLGVQNTKTLNTLADSLPGRLDDFALGMAAAAIFARERGAGERSQAPAGQERWIGPGVAAFAALALFTASAWLYDRDIIFGPVSPAVAVGGYFMANVAFFLLLLAALRSTGLLRRALTFAPLRLAGIGCYSLYLVHGPLAWIFRGPRLALVPAFLVATFALALVTYRFVEKPGMLRGKRVAP